MLEVFVGGLQCLTQRVSLRSPGKCLVFKQAAAEWTHYWSLWAESVREVSALSFRTKAAGNGGFICSVATVILSRQSRGTCSSCDVAKAASICAPCHYKSRGDDAAVLLLMVVQPSSARKWPWRCTERGWKTAAVSVVFLNFLLLIHVEPADKNWNQSHKMLQV